MKKITKGDWYASPPVPYADESTGERRKYCWTVHTSYSAKKGGMIGHQVCEISSMNCGTEEADALLIAAAPELLEACKAMLEWDDREKDHAVDFNARMVLCEQAFTKARAAIQKASGERA